MTEILIYGIVGDSWDGLDANTLVPLISAGDDDLDIRINSPGGYVMEGLAIYNAIVRERAKGRKVTTHIDGLAASMGSIIAMSGEDIIMADNALMMIHNPWDCACGDAVELRRAADRLDQLRDQLVGIYSKVTGLDADALIALLDAETWMTATEALAQNFITSFTPAEIEAAALDVTKFGFKKAPESPRIAALAMAGSRPAPATRKPKGTDMPPQGNDTVAGNDAPDTITTTQAQALADQAVARERTRTTGIRALAEKHSLGAAWADKMIDGAKTIEEARGCALDALAEQGDSVGIGHSGPTVTVTKDARDKWLTGAANSIILRAGIGGTLKAAAAKRGEKIDLDPGEFRGIRNAELARMSLEMNGHRVRSYDRAEIVGMAIMAMGSMGAQGYGGQQTTSDFAVLLENVMHKTLQAAYDIAPDTWTRVCGVGSVGDFRAHNRYIRGTFGELDDLTESGEFKSKNIPDAAKESIKAGTKGNMVGLSRQAIVNDDMDAFSFTANDLGRAAKLTIEKAFYRLLALNGGLGPIMNDGKTFFHADHGNIGTGAAPSVDAFDKTATMMAQQKDLSGNEFLDITPAIWLGPIGQRGDVVVINGAEYDPDTASKLQKPNKVRGLFSDIVGTPRLAGNPWYAFADQTTAPAFEVVFLDGEQEPQLDSKEGWSFDGIEWRVRHDHGIGGVNYRSGHRNPGAA